ncbi:MAG TPA: hypothetical protein VKR61_01585 [Bryobacteraceae bacterium]|nr:hypothetical protein [Bryobacteraceae bacterium]
MKRICSYLPLLSLLLLSVPFASAQSSVDFMLGFGTVHDSSNGGCIDTSTFAAYTSPSLDPAGPSACPTNPALNGFFLGIGGDALIWKHFGIGGEINVQPSRANYGPFQYRETFYDFDGIYAPISQKRVQLLLEGGIGGAHTSWYQSQSVGSLFSQSYPVATSNHFQLHAGVGLSLFVTEHIFIRPQFDLHYVPGFTDQFNSKLAPGATVWVGYNFGER